MEANVCLLMQLACNWQPGLLLIAITVVACLLRLAAFCKLLACLAFLASYGRRSVSTANQLSWP